jgi:hypothetical protein
MATDATTRDGEAKLLAMLATATASVEIEAGGAEPGDSDVLQRMPDPEDAEQPPVEVGTLILRGLHELELQRPLAGMAEARPTQVAARRRCLIGGNQRRVDGGIHMRRGLAAAVEVEHQKGTSAAAS